jgi:hypothetical protein
LNAAVANAFDTRGLVKKRTVLYLLFIKIKLSQRSTGFTKESKLLNWSMTKSITATLFGILEKQGKFDINKPAPIAEWQNDARKKITSDLLCLGLAWRRVMINI